jgi:hypothetical protein
VFPEYFDNVKKIVYAYISRKEINNNTLKRFGKSWVKNLSKNLMEFVFSPGLVHLQNIFKNKNILPLQNSGGENAEIPALIIAGGPSLDNVIPHLLRLKDKYLVIAVDTSFRACIAAGLIPDFVVVVDPQYWNFRHLDRCFGYDTILISEPSTYNSIFRIFRTNKFFSGSVFPLGQYFENFTFSRGKIGAGGSVATSAWDFARQAGCSYAVFAGLDLGYPDKKTHFKGSFFEERAHTLSYRLKQASDMDFSLIIDASLIKTKSNNGNIVFTDKRLEIYRQWFEEQFKMHNFKTFNLSANGVKIEGMDFISLDAALDKPDVRYLLDEKLGALKNFVQEYRNKNSKTVFIKTEIALNNLLSSLNDLSFFAGKARKSAENFLKYYKKTEGKVNPDIVKKVMYDLDNADRNILAEGGRNIAGFLLQDVIRSVTAVTAESPGNDLYTVIEKSFKIYFELENSIMLHQKYLKKCIVDFSVYKVR